VKRETHPELFDIQASCACGNRFQTRSTVDQIHVTLCSQCHPFFTGQQKFVDSAGRIEKFERKYQKVAKKA
jgi:large subunit ribosomal protein L31